MLTHVLLFTVLFSAGPSGAETASESTRPAATDTIPVISVIYSEQSLLQTEISLELLKQLTVATPSSSITAVQIHLIQRDNEPPLIPEVRQKTRLVIVIGSGNTAFAKQIFKEAPYLILATDPGKLNLKETGANDSILYMTQPLCRQLEFIHLLNPQWTRFSYLTSKKDFPDKKAVQACAKKYSLHAYRQYSKDINKLSIDLKLALRNADLLLALPDKNIYNRKTVKNILLTSYRLRKPVIAFSANFVNAGAIAAIHSSPKQISRTAIRMIAEKLSGGEQFRHHLNYPDAFDISINRRVFKALNLDIPDIETINSRLKAAPSVWSSAFAKGEPK